MIINETRQFQLPYYIDGNIKLSESGAIFRHLARKHGLEGTSEEEKCRIDVAENVLYDQFFSLVRLVFGTDFVS